MAAEHTIPPATQVKSHVFPLLFFSIVDFGLIFLSSLFAFEKKFTLYQFISPSPVAISPCQSALGAFLPWL